jgi:hypothetical protein
MDVDQLYKIGDFVFDKMTKEVVVVEYVDMREGTYRYLVRNKDSGGFRLQDQLYYSTTDLDGNEVPTTNEA